MLEPESSMQSADNMSAHLEILAGCVELHNVPIELCSDCDPDLQSRKKGQSDAYKGFIKGEERQHGLGSA